MHMNQTFFRKKATEAFSKGTRTSKHKYVHTKLGFQMSKSLVGLSLPLVEADSSSFPIVFFNGMSDKVSGFISWSSTLFA